MIAKIYAEIAVAVAADADLEDIATEFDGGLWNALQHFPSGEVVAATVEQIEKVSADEIAAQGWEE